MKFMKLFALTAILFCFSAIAAQAQVAGQTMSEYLNNNIAVNTRTVVTTEKTVATTSNTDFYVVAPCDGSLQLALFSGTDVLAANDTNFITFTVTNLGQAGAGTTVMLAATDPNTTKLTGGAALALHTKRTLVLNGTAANLVVAKGDRIRVRAAATGTLANTVTGSVVALEFTKTS